MDEATAKKILDMIMDVLPTGADANDRKFWTDGEMIFCPTEDGMNMVYNALLPLCTGTTCLCTGYYDPKEDKQMGEEDECTGYYYVKII